MALRDGAPNAVSTLIVQLGGGFLLQGAGIGAVAVWPGISGAGAGTVWDPASSIPAGISKQEGKDRGQGH